MTEEEFKAQFPNWEYLQFDYGRWTCLHVNYDASYEGPEDGWVDNGLRCEARTLDDLALECQAKEEEMK
jgi:hypothetical protein